MTRESAGEKSMRYSLNNPLCESLAIILLCPLLLAAAFWNQFPIFFYDTGAYLAEGLTQRFIIERSPVYSLLLWATRTDISFWLPAIAQALMTSVVMVEFARAEAPGLSLGRLLGIATFLVIATGLPWYVGQIVPDCFTALVALSVWLLAFRFTRLGRFRAVLILIVGGISVGAHPSHLALSAGLVLSLIALCLLGHFRERLPRPHLVFPAGIFLIGLSLVLSANWYLAGAPFVSRAGGVFVFARLVQDGIVKRLMDDTCPGSGYALCAYRHDLDRTADQWLWDNDSPFIPLGRFEGTAAESARIVKDSVLRYPLAHVIAAAKSTGLQLLAFRTGDQIEPQQWVLLYEIQHLVPHEAKPYLAAKQQIGEIDFKSINLLHVPVAILSFAAILCLFLRGMRRGEWEDAMLPAFLLLTLLGNAIVCGTFANPHDRYESRLIWIFTFSAALVFLRGRNWRDVLSFIRSRNWR